MNKVYVLYVDVTLYSLDTYIKSVGVCVWVYIYIILHRSIMIIDIKITLTNSLPLNQNTEDIIFRRKKLTSYPFSCFQNLEFRLLLSPHTVNDLIRRWKMLYVMKNW